MRLAIRRVNAVSPIVSPGLARGAYRLDLVVAAVVASLFPLVFKPLGVLFQRLLPHLFGAGLFCGQGPRRRPVPARQAVEEGAQALHPESVLCERLRATLGSKKRLALVGPNLDVRSKLRSQREALLLRSFRQIRCLRCPRWVSLDAWPRCG